MIAALTVAAAVSVTAPAAGLAASLPPCTANQLSLSFDTENGNFDGMSHSGALLVVRNFGDRACRFPALPTLQFQDAGRRPLALVRRAPAGMHPGPVVLPVGLAAGAEATARMRWVSGDVYDGHNCLTPTSVSLKVGSGSLTAAFHATLCGPARAPVPYGQEWLKTDPVLTAPSR